MKYIIGISAFYHNSSACLFKNGQLVFACEEEKFSGIKHDSSFPIKTLNYIFKTYKISKKDIEAVCYYEDPKVKLDRVVGNIKTKWYKNPIYSLKSYFEIRKNIKQLNQFLPLMSDNVFYSPHHKSHIYYSYYTSHFDKAVTLSIDGVGEMDTMSVGFCETDIDYMTLAKYPHSVGLFYSAMTSFLGFNPNDGEYKVMGLSAYGNPKTYIDKVRKLIKYDNTYLRCNMDVFCWDSSHTTMFNYKLCELLEIQPRDGEIEQCHMDLAAAVQLRYEEILFEVIKGISMISDTNNLCLGGGCAYNGLANGKIIDNSGFNKLWIPISPSDSGSAIGACVNYLVTNNKLSSRVNRNPFLGPMYYHTDLVTAVKGKRVYKFLSESNLLQSVARSLADGKVVGWYQGHIEFGERALGNRSILANPTLDGMQERINKSIKNRESFRPFAPMVISNRQDEYFEMNGDVPYMNQIVKVKPQYIDSLKAVTHVDGTARVQSVPKNTLQYQLLIEFEKLTGYPILLNTSFNTKDKPMVLTPFDAVKTFMETDIDLLVMGNYIIYKD
jgi:carbamoyltransferase